MVHACAKIDLTFVSRLWSPIFIYTCMVFIALLRFAFLCGACSDCRDFPDDDDGDCPRRGEFAVADDRRAEIARV